MPQEKLRPSFTFDKERIEQLKEIVPEAFADGKINWETLHEALGDYLEDENLQAEHFGLFWPGKREGRRLASIPSTGTLVPCIGEGINENSTKNIFVEGDNLEVLKLLQKSYAGRVKMIYIDPPYNTGNDFVYNDDFDEPLEQYLRVTGQANEEGILLTTNPKSSGRYHSAWLSMMYPRLLLAKQLLVEEGSIFISIDDNEINNLRMLLNDTFGEENFITQITIQSNPRGRQSERFVATVHEYLLIYGKNASRCRLLGSTLTPEQLKEFENLDETGQKYRLLGLRQRGSASRREDRPNMFYPIYVNPKTARVSLDKDEDFSVEVYPRKSTGADGRWMWSKDKVRNELNRVEARLISRRNEWDIFVRDYLVSNTGEERTRKVKTIWNEKELNYQNGTQEVKGLLGEGIYEYPKPVALLKQIVTMADDPNLICLDFFAGSCTTAHAILDMNSKDGGSRQFIMIQLPELTPADSTARKAGYNTIADIGKERIRRVIEKLKQENTKGDLGFKVFKLDHSNYKAWQEYHGEDVKQLEMLFSGAETPLVEGWTSESLLAEVMLIQGFPLDSKVTMKPEFKKNKVQLIESDASAHRLFVCLDEKIHEETEKALKVNSGDIFVCLDSSMTDQAKMRLANICTLATI